MRRYELETTEVFNVKLLYLYSAIGQEIRNKSTSVYRFAFIPDLNRQNVNEDGATAAQ